MDEFDVEIDTPAGAGPIPPPTPPPPIPPPRDADPDEEPPEPEGHVLTQKVADWINHGQEYFHGPLPHDIAAVWGHPPMRVGDEATCRMLIAAWGMDRFRGSALHQASLAEAARRANSQEVTARFKAEREKKEKGRR